MFFDAICLENSVEATANITADIYMGVITRGFQLDNMIGAFFSALGLFSIARAGGIPVPFSKEGKLLWGFIMCIQVLEYILVFLSAVMIVLGYFHVRYFHRDCMYEAMGLPVADIAFLSTVLAAPVINQSLLVMFIYAYVISTCLKVWNATTSSTSGYQSLGDEDESSSKAFKRALVRADQPFKIASFHIRIAFIGLAVSFVISLFTGGLFASLCFYPDFIAMVAVIKLTCAVVRWLEDDFFQGTSRLKVVHLDRGGSDQEEKLKGVAKQYEQYGKIKSVNITESKVKVAGAHGESTVYTGFITFDDSRDAAECLRLMTGKKIGGRELQVESSVPVIRIFTGWFRDMSFYMCKPRDNYLQGFRVWAVVQYPLIEFTSIFSDKYRKEEVGDVDDMGGGDADFVNMVYGFSVFFCCIALAPATCYGVWISVPVVFGSLPLSEAKTLILLYYEDLWELFKSFMTAMANFQLQWDWPDWLNFEAIFEFLEDPQKMIMEAFSYILSAIMFLNFDFERLIEGSRALLRLNSVLAAAKPLAAMLLKIWVVSSGRLKWLCNKISGVVRNEQADYLRLVFFGDLVPGKLQIQLAAKLRDLKASKKPVPDLKQDGYSAADLKDAGYTAAELLAPSKDRSNVSLADSSFSSAVGAVQQAAREWFSVKELLEAKFSLEQMRDASVSCDQLHEQGVSAKDMWDAGYTAKELKVTFQVQVLKQDCEASAHMMREAECSARELKTGGYTMEDIKAGGYDVAALLAENFSASELKALFPAQAFKQAGLDAQNLQREGFSAAELKPCFSAAELKGTFSAAKLLEARFSPKELCKADFTARELRDARCSLHELKLAGFRLTALKGVFSAQELKAEFNAKELLQAGLTITELRNARFTAKELREAGFTLSDLTQAGFKLDDLKAVFNVQELSGQFSPRDLKHGGISPRDMMVKGGLSLETLKSEGGFDAKRLKREGFKPSELVQVYTVSELRSAGFTAVECKAYFDVSSMANTFTAQQLKEAQFSAADLIQAKSIPELKAAGFSAEQLRDAGCKAQQLKDAGFEASYLKDLFRPAELRNAGYGPKQFREARFSLTACKNAGFTPVDLKPPLFTAQELSSVFTPAEMKQAFNAKQMKEQLGYDAKKLKNAGCSAREAKLAGFTVREMRDAGYTVSELRMEFELSQLRSDSNFKGTNLIPIDELCAGGVPLEDARNERNVLGRIWSDAQLRAAGYVLPAPASAPAPESCANSPLTDLEGSGSTTPSLSIGQKVGDLI